MEASETSYCNFPMHRSQSKWGVRYLPGYTTEHLERMQGEDPTQVVNFVRRGQKPDRTEWASLSREVLVMLRDWERLFIRDRLLYRKVVSPSDQEETFQLMISVDDFSCPAGVEEVMQKFHHDAGHFGPKRTWCLIWNHFYWRHMEGSTKEWCAKCQRCAISKPPVDQTRPPLYSLP